LQRVAVGDDRGRVAPEDWSGDGCGRGAPLQGEQRPLCEWQERRPRLFLGHPGGGLERAHRFREQRDLPPARQHGRRVIERAV
jgi:hypothetical protein